MATGLAPKPFWIFMTRKIFSPLAGNRNSVRSAQRAVTVLTELSPLTISVEHKVTK
jgi:hypothetical protein